MKKYKITWFNGFNGRVNIVKALSKFDAVEVLTIQEGSLYDVYNIEEIN